jgi:hypothetical protein
MGKDEKEEKKKNEKNKKSKKTGRLRPHVQVGACVGEGRHVRADRVEDRHEVARIQARGTLQVQPLEPPPLIYLKNNNII